MIPATEGRTYLKIGRAFSRHHHDCAIGIQHLKARMQTPYNVPDTLTYEGPSHLDASHPSTETRGIQPLSWVLTEVKTFDQDPRVSQH